MSEEKEKVESIDAAEKTVCPLCGAHEYVEPTVSEDLKDAFLVSILGAEPFTRTYDIMGGRVNITVKGLDDEDNLNKSKLYVNIFRLADTTPDIKSYVPVIEMGMDLDCQVMSVQVDAPGSPKPVILDRVPGSGLKKVLELNWDVKNAEEGKALIDSVLRIFDDNLLPGSTIPKQILRGVVGKHNITIMNLIKACLDENFLSGTGR